MIRLNNLTKKYDDNIILENVSFDFPSNGIVCLMGASGGGKTTLLNLLAGFDTAYDGDIEVGGTSISSLDAESLCRYRRDNIGFIFQNYHLLHGYTVLENVLLACDAIGKSSDTDKQKSRELIKRLGIEGKENEKVENLSGGQKQRVAIARALVNNPQIIFADEPTGALDRTTSVEIMTLLKEISADRLVAVITHDQKICGFADEVIHIEDKKLIANQSVNRDFRDFEDKKLFISAAPVKSSVFHCAVKNFKVHMKRYIAVSLAISIGMLAFLISLSFSNVTEQSIDDFKTKNTAFNNGYIKGADDGTILDYLMGDERIENVFYQYILGETSISIGNKSEILPEKFPTPKATESLSYGIMPRKGMNEISITPSFAKKFSADIDSLIGQKVTLKLDEQSYTLTVSGIYNAGYDDYFVSSDIEQQFYKGITNKENYSISYDVKNFSDISEVSSSLKLRNIESKNAADEVYALEQTFDSLNKLFAVISIMILAIGLFICTVLLVKLQNTRYHEVGLLSALGFSRHKIKVMIFEENLLLSGLSTLMNIVLLLCSVLICRIISFAFIVSGLQIVLCAAATFAAVAGISSAVSYKLICTEPAEALRK